MKNSNLFINLSCIPVLLILCMVKLTAQDDLIGYTYLDAYFFDDHYYYISDCEATWEEANEAATEMGGYLATLFSFDNNGGIGLYAAIFTSWQGAWIGWRGEQGIYQWANGEPETHEPFWDYDYGGPILADGAALIGTDHYFSYYWTFGWISRPISGEFKYIVEFNSPPDCNTNNPNKTYVCHNGNTICVNTAAVQAHLDHGDLEGPCGPCNNNAMQTLPSDESEIKGKSLRELTVADSESDQKVHEISSSNQIHVFPNPTSAEIHVMLPEANQEGTLRIMSLTGQEIHVRRLQGQQSITFDISTFAAGIYLIEVRSANDHYQKKIVKL